MGQEQARLILALGLSFLIFLVWGFFFSEKAPEQKAPIETAQQEPATQPEKAPIVKPQAVAPVTIPQPTVAKSARTIAVETPLFIAKIAEQGGALISLQLKDYREAVDPESPMKELIDENLPLGSVLISFQKQSLPNLEKAIFTADTNQNLVQVAAGSKNVKFTAVLPNGAWVEKTYTFLNDSYLIGLTVAINNGSAQSIVDKLEVALHGDTRGQGSGYGFQGPSGLVNDSLEQIKIKNIAKENLFKGKIGWIAIQDRYFMSSIIPAAMTEASMQLGMVSEEVFKNQIMMPEVSIPAGTQKVYEYDLYFGPRSMRILKSLGNGLARSINFGMFDFLAKPCLWLMNLFYQVIPNYGIAIIILTLLTKILLWPLGNKSYKSMNQMKKLQPLMTEIRQKHKNDKKKMNEEVMALYRTYKINPLGGCLPMVAQIPVFFALYRMLYEAIELRHAPFFGWINDLSAPDRLFHFDFSIPFMQPPYGIPVLTLIMGASMLLQQKMSPPPGDPSQAKIMMLMPIIFTFIFINFSSGLVLYWFVNNILSIGQQYYIQKKAG